MQPDAIYLSDSEPPEKEPLCMPSFHPPSASEFETMMNDMDDVQILREGLRIVWHAKIHRLYDAGRYENVRSATTDEVVMCVINAHIVPPPGECLPPQYWANNCKLHSPNLVLHGNPAFARP